VRLYATRARAFGVLGGSRVHRTSGSSGMWSSSAGPQSAPHSRWLYTARALARQATSGRPSCSHTACGMRGTTWIAADGKYSDRSGTAGSRARDVILAGMLRGQDAAHVEEHALDTLAVDPDVARVDQEGVRGRSRHVQFDRTADRRSMAPVYDRCDCGTPT